MKERRKSIRRATDLDIEFKITEVKFRQSTKILSRGKIVDMSDLGFRLVTRYPLEKGQVITIKAESHNNIPKFGLAQWTENNNGIYSAGFGYKFNGNT